MIPLQIHLHISTGQMVCHPSHVRVRWSERGGTRGVSYGQPVGRCPGQRSRWTARMACHRPSKPVVPLAAKRPAMLDSSLGAPAVGLLLAGATFAQTLAGLMQARKEDTSMINNLRVTYSSLMVTASSVLINLVTASSAPRALTPDQGEFGCMPLPCQNALTLADTGGHSR
jgi:hypothetical protein